MTTVILGLVAGYVLLAVLLLIMLLYSRVHWAAKALVVVVVSAFYPVTYFSLMALLGWPTEQELPQRFRLVAAQVYEPDKTRGTGGRIYLWVASLADDAGRVTPRAFEIAYSDTLHNKITEANKSLHAGKPQMAEVEKQGNLADSPFRIFDFARTEPVAAEINFFELSETVLPEK